MVGVIFIPFIVCSEGGRHFNASNMVIDSGTYVGDLIGSALEMQPMLLVVSLAAQLALLAVIFLVLLVLNTLWVK